MSEASEVPLSPFVLKSVLRICTTVRTLQKVAKNDIFVYVDWNSYIVMSILD